MNVHGALMIALANQETAGSLVAFGQKIGKLYTDFGLPIDMALERLPASYTKEQKLLVLHGALSWLIEHRRNSSAGDNAIERQRKLNRHALELFWADKETGMY
jgi:hypothetical protein